MSQRQVFLTPAGAAQTRTILFGASLMLSLSMGMRQSLGLFLLPMSHDLGVTTANFTFAVALQNVSWGVAQPFVGGIADKYGCRPAMVAGALLYAAAVLVMLTAGGTAALTVAGILIGIALACTASSLAMTASARAAPESRRSFVLGVVSAVGSLGTLLIAPIVQQLIAREGWHVGMAFYVVLAIVMVPAAWLAGGSDKLPKRGGDAVGMRQVIGLAVHHRPFLVMSGAYFVCGLNLVFLTTHLPTYLSLCGMDPMLGATALATIGGFNVIGSWLFGWLGGRYPKHILLGLLYILRSGVLTAFFFFPPTPASTVVFAAAMGMLWMGVMPLTSGLVAEMFGTRYMATLLGLSFMVHQAGSFLGAWGGGLIYDMLGSYDRAWQFGVTVGLLAGFVQIEPVARAGDRTAWPGPPWPPAEHPPRSALAFRPRCGHIARAGPVFGRALLRGPEPRSVIHTQGDFPVLLHVTEPPGAMRVRCPGLGRRHALRRQNRTKKGTRRWRCLSSLAPAPRSWRAFRSPHPTLEPQDGAVSCSGCATGIHIIDLQQSVPMLDRALRAVRDVVASRRAGAVRRHQAGGGGVCRGQRHAAASTM